MQVNHERLLTAAQTQILSEKSLRYKRNSLVLGVVIICGHLLDVRFDDLSVFGAKLLGNQALLAFILLWLAYIYNLAMFVRFGRSDWQTWVDNLTGRWGSDEDNRTFFPELAMYWQREPESPWTMSRRFGLGSDKFVKWDGYEVDPSQTNLICYADLKNFPPRPDEEPTSRQQIFTVPMILVDTVHRAVNQVKIFELGIPAAVFGLAIAALIFDLGVWWLQPEGCMLICS